MAEGALVVDAELRGSEALSVLKLLEYAVGPKVGRHFSVSEVEFCSYRGSKAER